MNVEEIRAAQTQVAEAIKDYTKQVNNENADTVMRLTSMTVEAGISAAMFEIAVQLAELNSKLDSVIGKDRDLNKRVRVF